MKNSISKCVDGIGELFSSRRSTCGWLVARRGGRVQKLNVIINQEGAPMSRRHSRVLRKKKLRRERRARINKRGW